MPVLTKGKRRSRSTQFWAHATDDRSWNGPAPPAVCYIFAHGRGYREIKAQLDDYEGLLQVDGYVAYKALEKASARAVSIQVAFCLAHARPIHRRL